MNRTFREDWSVHSFSSNTEEDTLPAFPPSLCLVHLLVAQGKNRTSRDFADRVGQLQTQRKLRSTWALDAPREWGQDGFQQLPLARHSCRCCPGVTQPLVTPLLEKDALFKSSSSICKSQHRLLWETVGGRLHAWRSKCLCSGQNLLFGELLWLPFVSV